MLKSAKQAKHREHYALKLRVYNAVVLPSFLLQLWVKDVVWQTHQEAGEFARVSPQIHSRNMLAGPHHQLGGPGPFANSTSIDSKLIKTQLWWVGHVIGMEEHGMAGCLL